MENRGWILDDLDVERLRNLVTSYDERDSETAIPALRRIADLLETEGKETKDLVRLFHLPKDEHPWPNFSGEEEKFALMSHLIHLISVIESDFSMIKTDLVKKDPAAHGVIFERLYVGRFRSSLLEKMDNLVIKELRAQKAEDLVFLIYMVMSVTLNKRMVTVMVGLFNNPDRVESVEKLKRLKKCLCDVLSVGRDFIGTHGFVPQPKSFPVPQLSQPQEMEQEGSHSLVMRHVEDTDHLIEQVFRCIGVIGDCSFSKLKLNQLEEVEEVVTKIESALEKCAVAEGSVYLEAFEEQQEQQ